MQRVAESLPLLPIIFRPEQIPRPASALREIDDLEVAVEHHLGVEPAFAGVINLLEEDAIEIGLTLMRGASASTES